MFEKSFAELAGFQSHHSIVLLLLSYRTLNMHIDSCPGGPMMSAKWLLAIAIYEEQWILLNLRTLILFALLILVGLH